MINAKYFSCSVLLLAAMIGAAGCRSPKDSPVRQRELLRDAHFQNGFTLLEPEPGKCVAYGRLAGFNAKAKPAWDLSQWSSRFPLQPDETRRAPSIAALDFTNAAKVVIVGRQGKSEADLSLRVNASAEYGSQARKSGKEPWVHLLVQQNFQDQPALTPRQACLFHLEARLKDSILHRTDDYTPDVHAAQFIAYFAVSNCNKNSPGHGEYFWFGVPIYDDRHRIVPAFEARDFGQSKMFISTPSSAVFSSKSAHDGEWIIIEKDIVPLIKKGLEHAWAKGFVPGSRDFADYRIVGTFIGWEVPGIFDVELQLRNLSLKAIE